MRAGELPLNSGRTEVRNGIYSIPGESMREVNEALEENHDNSLLIVDGEPVYAVESGDSTYLLSSDGMERRAGEVYARIKVSEIDAELEEAVDQVSSGETDSQGDQFSMNTDIEGMNDTEAGYSAAVQSVYRTDGDDAEILT